MSHSHERPKEQERRGFVRGAQDFAGGIFLLLLAALGLWLMRGLPQGRLSAMGPAMLPDWLSIGVGLCGVALLVNGLLKHGAALERWSLRGPVFIILAILAFAATIRPLSLGGFSLPGLGMIVAGPLAILIGGCATPEARLRELVILSLSLTPFCMLLFGDMLNLPIPVFPQALTGLFPAGWSQKDILRACSAIMAAAALIMFLTGRRRHTTKVDVAIETEQG
ncbi:tripartite tricarboxylate transporter TctB family protein [Microvirga flavescens]|uniref:tripartite tricarboxylate transporter TctB family protein n=1 Tax=Microvirga flavescens TaxID=2249811 RepID=UPI000DD54F1F|nr:tripartite tricarboxylate transporter TctB family protein [Microvirga flavescens]